MGWAGCWCDGCLTGEKSVLQCTQALLLRVPDAYTTKPLGLPPFVAALVLWRERRFSFGEMKMNEIKKLAEKYGVSEDFMKSLDAFVKECEDKTRRLHVVNADLLNAAKLFIKYDSYQHDCSGMLIAYNDAIEATKAAVKKSTKDTK